MRRSEQVVVLMDSSKIGLTSTYSICGFEDVNVIISDGNLPEDFLEACRQYHVTVY
jgi:DeoR family transcriptional regulator of aga operon